MKKHFLAAAVLGFGLSLSPVFGQGGDTSADVSSFEAHLDKAPGVVIRVPIDDQGRENSTNAELRVADFAVASADAVKTAFDQGEPASDVPEITSEDVSKDSSTWGFYSYRYNWGWAPAYYYYSYIPTYYNRGYWYNYSTPTYYYNYYGYRYYYYPRFFY